MCGIAGCLEFAAAPANLERIHAMTEALVHRGPDDSGFWIDREARLALGHRRLAVIDLTDAGHQPMTSSCGRLVIIYNGEVYNAADLRRELTALGRTFRGHCDTEVVLEACAEWGLERTLEKLIGMFAFALWDTRGRRLSLVRDRLGIKPLYWANLNGLFLFASELKSFRATPDFSPQINRAAVSDFLQFNYVPAPQAIYQGVSKLAPGTVLTVGPDGKTEIKAYWTLADAVSRGRAAAVHHSDEEAVDALEALLTDAVERHMIADVPLGIFLSGGIDSSTVAALMQKCSTAPVRSFSIGFHEAGRNEADHAHAVARHLGTEHTELYVTSREAMNVIPKLAAIYDEPCSDASQIPTYLISALTRGHVTAAMSGDGGDELFGGYDRYGLARTLQGCFWALPAPLRRALAHGATGIPVRAWNAVLGRLPITSRISVPGDKIHKLADVLLQDRENFYSRLVTHWGEGTPAVGGGEFAAQWDASGEVTDDLTQRMQFADTMTYLPDIILAKVDRASMAVSLEARVPLLDHRIVEFSWGLPAHLKIRKGEGKWILRQILYRHVPRELVERPKMGFGVPIDDWLRGPLRPWAEDLLSEATLRRYDLIDPDVVRARWHEHLSGQRNWQYLIWNALVLQSWCEEWM